MVLMAIGLMTLLSFHATAVHAQTEEPVIALSTASTDISPTGGQVTIHARLEPTPAYGVWRDCHLRRSGGTAILDVDYRLSTAPFKFNRNHGWAMDTHVTVLPGATVDATIELQAYCDDRSAAAQHLASHPLQSNSLVLALQWERESYLTCGEYQALLQNTGIDTVANAGNPRMRTSRPRP